MSDPINIINRINNLDNAFSTLLARRLIKYDLPLSTPRSDVIGTVRRLELDSINRISNE